MLRLLHKPAVTTLGGEVDTLPLMLDSKRTWCNSEQSQTLFLIGVRLGEIDGRGR